MAFLSIPDVQRYTGAALGAKVISSLLFALDRRAHLPTLSVFERHEPGRNDNNEEKHNESGDVD
jgi:hypothetical protein